MEARQLIESLQSELARVNHLNKLKDQEIALLYMRIFGPKSEKLSQSQIPLLLEEPSLTLAEVDQEAEVPEVQKQNLPRAKRQHNHPGREKLPEHLERREVIIACHPADCRCSQCGQERPIIGYEVREELACEPARFWVKVIKREKRGSHCLEEQGVATAPAPAQIVAKSKLSLEFIIEVLAQKYQQHVPIYRQCAWLEDNYQIELSRKTVTDAVLAAGALLIPVVKAQARELLAGKYLQADETTMPCQTHEKTGKHHKAYMWEYSRPAGPVVFEFQMGRSREGPREFLKNFQGKLQCDGYGVYDKLGEGIECVACMAHIRRGFVEAAKLAPKDLLPQEIIALMGKLYGVEEEARTSGLTAEKRQELRSQKSKPVMEELKKRIIQIRQAIMPGEKLYKACDYALGQWSRMEKYLEDGEVEIDNNWCEGAIRPLALGRKNWLHIGSAEAGPKVAAIASIVETCRRLEINVRNYLRAILPVLGDWPVNRVAELTPSAWKARQAS